MIPAHFIKAYFIRLYKRRLKAAIVKYNSCKPLLVTSDGTIIDGHTRATIMKELGRKTVPAIIIDAPIVDFDLDNIKFAYHLDMWTLKKEVNSYD